MKDVVARVEADFDAEMPLSVSLQVSNRYLQVLR
jgi:hypothetical protein